MQGILYAFTHILDLVILVKINILFPTLAVAVKLFLFFSFFLLSAFVYCCSNVRENNELALTGKRHIYTYELDK